MKICAKDKNKMVRSSASMDGPNN